MSGFGYPVDSKNDFFFPIKFSFYILYTGQRIPTIWSFILILISLI